MKNDKLDSNPLVVEMRAMLARLSIISSNTTGETSDLAKQIIQTNAHVLTQVETILGEDK